MSGLFETGQTRLQKNTENISIRAAGDLLSRGSREFADAYNVPLVSVMMEQARPMGRHSNTALKIQLLNRTDVVFLYKGYGCHVDQQELNHPFNSFR